MRHSTNYKHVCGHIRDLQADLGLEADLMGIHSRQTTGLCHSFLIHQLIMKMSVHSHNSRMFSGVLWHQIFWKAVQEECSMQNRRFPPCSPLISQSSTPRINTKLTRLSGSSPGISKLRMVSCSRPRRLLNGYK